MTEPAQHVEQDTLLPGMVRARVGRAPVKTAVGAAEVDPVAEVLVDVALAHLDRSFDYLVPTDMHETCVPGARVRVRFAGKEVDGFVLARRPSSEHEGQLQPLRRVVSAEPVLTPEVADLCRAVAERCAGTRPDVVRLAVPPRHARAELAARPAAPGPPRDSDPVAAWSDHTAGAAWIEALLAGGAPRAVWTAEPTVSWPRLVAEAVAATYRSGRGALVCVPDRRDVDRVSAALDAVLGPDHHVVLTADTGPAARYRAFLAVSRGDRRIVVGNRAAAFAPVERLGLVVVWDDGDDLHAEPRAPYPHVREVMLLRAHRQEAAALVGGFARTVEGDYLVATGWAHAITPTRQRLRSALTVGITGATDTARARDPMHRAARIPGEAHALLKTALTDGPVLVQTPRAGWAASLACDRCRTPARCDRCHGPLRQGSPERAPECGWCARGHGDWTCAECGHRGLRAPLRGNERTAEELGRAFPGVLVRSSGGDRVLDRIPAAPAIVVATPGAEPTAEGGYRAVLLLDTWLLLGRADLRATEEALRRWFNAAALAAPGGRVLAVGDAADPTLQALVRWDPAGFAAREREQRQSARLAPASRMATLTGTAGALADALVVARWPQGADVLGPTETTNGQQQLVVRVPRKLGDALSAALVELQRVRSSRKLDPVRVQVDPMSL